jgi:hypothetical protein
LSHRSVKPLHVSFALLSTVLVACGKEDPKPTAAPASAPSADHAHPPAPHGGEVQSLGDDEYHLEMIHDHDGGHVTVYVLGKDLKTPILVEAPVINLVTKTGPAQFTLTAIDPKPDGKAEGWKGSHEGLRVDPWDGRIRIKIGDKTYQSPLEGPAHTHD